MAEQSGIPEHVAKPRQQLEEAMATYGPQANQLPESDQKTEVKNAVNAALQPEGGLDPEDKLKNDESNLEPNSLGKPDATLMGLANATVKALGEAPEQPLSPLGGKGPVTAETLADVKASGIHPEPPTNGAATAANEVLGKVENGVPQVIQGLGPEVEESSQAQPAEDQAAEIAAQQQDVTNEPSNPNPSKPLGKSSSSLWRSLLTTFGRADTVAQVDQAAEQTATSQADQQPVPVTKLHSKTTTGQ